MNFIFWFLILALTAIFSYPKLYDQLAGLEDVGQGAEVPLRLAQSAGAFVAAATLCFKSEWFRQGAILPKVLGPLLAIVWLEFVIRLFFKQIVPRFEPTSRLRQLEHSIRECSSTLGEFSWIDPRPHPFLQFTGVRWVAPNGERGLGFGIIHVSNIPKLEGMVRIACLGNSTTADGYPERLEEFLNCCGGGRQFEVFNFGLGWWTSAHTMMNFVVNVRDFQPDFVVLCENCNDEKYRGFTGMRGDFAHAMRPLTFEHHRDEWLYRFSLIYRLGLMLVSLRFPRKYYWPGAGVALNRGKSWNFVPEELRLFRRNIETICDLAASDGTRTILLTMPFSKVLRYTKSDEDRFHPHLLNANAILRQVAEEKAVELIDLERLFVDSDDFFYDPFHLGSQGVAIKALEVGKSILCSLGLTPTLSDSWKQVELSKPPSDDLS